MDQEGNTALCISARRGNTRLVERLCDAKASLNLEAVTITLILPLYPPNRGPHPKPEPVPEPVPEPEANDSTPLIFAAENGFSDIVEILLESSAKVTSAPPSPNANPNPSSHPNHNETRLLCMYMEISIRLKNDTLNLALTSDPERRIPHQGRLHNCRGTFCAESSSREHTGTCHTLTPNTDSYSNLDCNPNPNPNPNQNIALTLN